MAGGSMGKLTHLQAFCSPDAFNGRIWVDEHGWAYRRTCRDQVEYCMVKDAGSDGEHWLLRTVQVAAVEGTVTWADEPKTLTPQEALLALADGKSLQYSGNDSIYRICSYGTLVEWSSKNNEWVNATAHDFAHLRVVPDPSQPADYVHAGKPITKVRDNMRDFDYGPLWPEHAHTELPSERQPAEPQVEHNSYCDRAGAYPRSHPCVRCQSDYLKRKQQEGK